METIDPLSSPTVRYQYQNLLETEGEAVAQRYLSVVVSGLDKPSDHKKKPGRPSLHLNETRKPRQIRPAKTEGRERRSRAQLFHDAEFALQELLRSNAPITQRDWACASGISGRWLGRNPEFRTELNNRIKAHNIRVGQQAAASPVSDTPSELRRSQPDLLIRLHCRWLRRHADELESRLTCVREQLEELEKKFKVKYDS
jgi:hypothetical protein